MNLVYCLITLLTLTYTSTLLAQEELCPFLKGIPQEIAFPSHKISRNPLVLDSNIAQTLIYKVIFSQLFSDNPQLRADLKQLSQTGSSEPIIYMGRSLNSAETKTLLKIYNRVFTPNLPLLFLQEIHDQYEYFRSEDYKFSCSNFDHFPGFDFYFPETVINEVLISEYQFQPKEQLWVRKKEAPFFIGQALRSRKTLSTLTNFVHLISTFKDKDSFQNYLEQLQKVELGGKEKGTSDRKIVAEAFSSIIDTDGSIPAFVSADRGLARGLIRLKISQYYKNKQKSFAVADTLLKQIKKLSLGEINKSFYVHFAKDIDLSDYLPKTWVGPRKARLVQFENIELQDSYRYKPRIDFYFLQML